METNSDIFLEHFGVKGMKWGVRRTRTESSSGRSGSTRSGTTAAEIRRQRQKEKVIQQTRSNGKKIAAGLLVGGVGAIAVGVAVKNHKANLRARPDPVFEYIQSRKGQPEYKTLLYDYSDQLTRRITTYGLK